MGHSSRYLSSILSAILSRVPAIARHEHGFCWDTCSTQYQSWEVPLGLSASIVKLVTMLAISIFFLAFSLHISAFPEATRCKSIPESLNWPTLSDWSNLNSSLGGVLLRPAAPAAACHQDNPLYDATKCKAVVGNWTSSQWHSDNPTSSLWQNWNGYSCLPNAKSGCSTEGYPVYVVNVTRPEHVNLAVNFAREKDIRLNIKSTGHDFLGR
jgi:hypothetical protein